MTTTLADLIDEARRLYYETGEPIANAAHKVATSDLNHDDLTKVVSTGFHTLITEAIKADRTGQTVEIDDRPLRPRLQFAPNRARMSQLRRQYMALMSITYETPNGVKALIDFNSEDLQYRIGIEKSVQAGAARRVGFLEEANKALTDGRKKQLSNLSADVLVQLNESATQAFKYTGEDLT